MSDAKRKRKQSPTSRTLAVLRKLGGVAAVVERRIPGLPITQDLFGFIDVVCLMGPNIIAVQATSGANHAHRRAKIRGEPNAVTWLKAGGLIELWSWAKQGPRGKQKLWQSRKEAITLEDLQTGEVSR